MNIYEKPNTQFCDYPEAVRYFRNIGCTEFPELHIAEYYNQKEIIQTPVWTCIKPDHTPVILFIFDLPTEMKTKLFQIKLSDPMEDGMVYADGEGLLYNAIETAEGLSLRKLNLIHNEDIAETYGAMLFGDDETIDISYNLCHIKGVDDNGKEINDFYWVGHPNDCILREDATNGESPVKLLTIPVFYQDVPLEDFQIANFEIEVQKSCSFFMKKDTLWRVIDTLENGLQIITAAECSSVQRKLKS